jgi:N6-adenosine-specific RNA methylase IME4
MGYWLRVQTEDLIVCPINLPAWRSSERNVYQARPGRHSEKPAYFREQVERYGPPPRLELFARQAVPEWTTLGDELDGRDVVTALNDTGGTSWIPE